MGRFDEIYHDPDIFRQFDATAFTRGKNPGKGALLNPIFLSNLTDPQNARLLARGKSLDVGVTHLPRDGEVNLSSENAA